MDGGEWSIIATRQSIPYCGYRIIFLPPRRTLASRSIAALTVLKVRHLLENHPLGKVELRACDRSMDSHFDEGYCPINHGVNLSRLAQSCRTVFGPRKLWRELCPKCPANAHSSSC